jgi:hypothetical protein
MKKSPEKSLTKDPSQAEMVTIALYLLGGAQKAIDTEDIAIKAHELAPGRFSWRKYPNQINLELIRVFLSDAKKREYLIGVGRTGWRLSQKGLAWAKKAASAINKIDVTRTRAQLRSGSIDEQRWLRERQRLMSSTAWDLWRSGATIGIAEAKDIFRIDSYAKGDLREAKMTRLQALFSQDEELAPFLDRLVNVLNREAKT